MSATTTARTMDDPCAYPSGQHKVRDGACTRCAASEHYMVTTIHGRHCRCGEWSHAS